MTATATAATWTKLRSGEWGIRSTDPLDAGDSVTVTTRAGKSSEVIVGRVVWTDGRVSIATIQADATRTRRNNGTRAGHGRGECCECGEWGPSGQWCRECGGEGIHS